MPPCTVNFSMVRPKKTYHCFCDVSLSRLCLFIAVRRWSDHVSWPIETGMHLQRDHIFLFQPYATSWESQAVLTLRTQKWTTKHRLGSARTFSLLFMFEKHNTFFVILFCYSFRALYRIKRNKHCFRTVNSQTRETKEKEFYRRN